MCDGADETSDRRSRQLNHVHGHRVVSDETHRRPEQKKGVIGKVLAWL